MTSRHYDVVVLGRTLGALTSAALLARRGFSVLLLGHGRKPASYRFEEHTLRRRAFTLLAGSSPAWRRVLQELAQTPRFRRRTTLLDPMFSFVAGSRRIEVPPDVDLFSREVDREFPEVRQVVDELYATIAQVNAVADEAFERELVVPPGSLLERLETGRVVSALPLTGEATTNDLLGKFPVGHPFRDVVTTPALFAAALATSAESMPPFALARLHGAWTRGVQTLGGDEDELADFLLERIASHGGLCNLDGRAARVTVRRGRIQGVIVDGDEEPTGATWILADLSGEQLVDLAGGEGITKRARRDWPRLSAAAGRYVVSLIVDRRLLPVPLGKESFLTPEHGSRSDPRRLTLHLQWSPVSEEPQRALLVAEAILPTRGALTLLEAREAVLAALRETLPFLDEHRIVVDSPHDGLPVWDYSSGRRREVDRVHVPHSSPGAEPMEWLWTVEPPGWLKLAGEPVRGPIPGTYLVGSTVLPALGQEGTLLAAWSAVRLVTSEDRPRQRIRRQMWTKIETG